MFTEPSSYKDIVLAPTVELLLDNIVTNRLPFPSSGTTGLLLYGPYGTGKSTLARLLPGSIDSNRGGSKNVLPIQHRIRSGDNGTGLIKSMSKVIENVVLDGVHHYFILDELDNLGSAAMQSLKNVMDPSAAIFIMTTNHLDRIDRAVSLTRVCVSR